MSWGKSIQVVITKRKKLSFGYYGNIRVGYNKDDKNQYYAVEVIEKKHKHLNGGLKFLSVIDSPNVIAMKAKTTEEGDTNYIANEMWNGGSLEELLEAKGGFLTEKEALFVLLEIIKGVVSMHDEKIMHRDLKPENIMLHFPELSYK